MSDSASIARRGLEKQLSDAAADRVQTAKLDATPSSLSVTPAQPLDKSATEVAAGTS
jgi:hypothetical protein